MNRPNYSTFSLLVIYRFSCKCPAIAATHCILLSRVCTAVQKSGKFMRYGHRKLAMRCHSHNPNMWQACSNPAQQP